MLKWRPVRTWIGSMLKPNGKHRSIVQMTLSGINDRRLITRQSYRSTGESAGV